MITKEQLDEIMARCNAAAEVQWTCDYSYVGYEGENYIFDCQQLDEDGSHSWDEIGRKNLEFAAHARTDIPLLIAEIERQAEEIKGLRFELYQAVSTIEVRNAELAKAEADSDVFKACAVSRTNEVLALRSRLAEPPK